MKQNAKLNTLTCNRLAKVLSVFESSVGTRSANRKVSVAAIMLSHHRYNLPIVLAGLQPFQIVDFEKMELRMLNAPVDGVFTGGVCSPVCLAEQEGNDESQRELSFHTCKMTTRILLIVAKERRIR